MGREMVSQLEQKECIKGNILHKQMEYLRSGPCGRAETCWLSYEPENTAAKALYHHFGFRENGQQSGGEIVAVARL